ncbi:MAG: ABC transporter ATP-binding protein [Pseudomonadota bacterium]|nr:ABC transporter ATP-binding protein [Pseudomonadota bacterium]
MLKVTNLHAGYGRMPILHGVDLAVPAGEITLVLGPNGAGKSTLLRSIGGFIRPTEGKVSLDGKDITGRAPDRMVSEGLRLVLDGHRVFPQLSVRDNLRLGVADRSEDYAARLGDVFGVFPVLEERLDQAASSLSGGQQQMLALAQAFLARPRVLLVDEPSLGIAQMLVPTILNFLRSWADKGTAVLLVEQRIDIAVPFADSVSVLRGGKIALSGPASDFTDVGEIERVYLEGAD